VRKMSEANTEDRSLPRLLKRLDVLKQNMYGMMDTMFRCMGSLEPVKTGDTKKEEKPNLPYLQQCHETMSEIEATRATLDDYLNRIDVLLNGQSEKVSKQG